MLTILLLIAQSIPSTWLGVGTGYNTIGSPKWTTTVSYSKLVNQQQKIYSFSSFDETFQSGKVPSVSPRTGGLADIKQIKQFHCLAYATAGVTQTSTATTGSLALGGLLLYQFKNGLTFNIGYRSANTGAGGKTIFINFGKGW